MQPRLVTRARGSDGSSSVPALLLTPGQGSICPCQADESVTVAVGLVAWRRRSAELVTPPNPEKRRQAMDVVFKVSGSKSPF
jgi:hypothetical protein